MDKLSFKGRVVIVTGAGGGLGRNYALDFAERGASVVVNDLGGDIHGGGKASAAADKVVNEIKSKGGIAVANYDSVENGDKIVQTALENFGRIDVVVNNAGILRDKSFVRISDLDWDLIHRVHLKGSFLVTRAAWPHMKKQKYGRIIMTSSAAGIYGNFGQANYGAAKLGLLGLSNTLAVEGAKYNIQCNTIAPIAGSRLTETVMPPEQVAALKPEFVSPLVVYLCHEKTEATGGLFECGAGWFSKSRWERSQGKVLRGKGRPPLSPESVRDNWEAITNFSDAHHVESMAESSVYFAQYLNEAENGPEMANTNGETSGNNSLDPSAAIGAKLGEVSFSYWERDVILYALGVGMGTREPDYLKFLFEKSEDFCVLPTFGVIPAFPANTQLFAVEIPGLNDLNPAKLLHGEQYMELRKPLPTSGKLTSESTVSDILDKGSGMIIVTDVLTKDEKGEVVVFNQFSSFIVGSGGFGGKRSSSVVKPTAKAPSRQPDSSIQEKTLVDQAALYRLSGDENPLHIDPSFAAMGGFAQPILHGLCSMGYAARHVLKQYAGNDVTKFKAIKVRFANTVLPGQTIRTDMWKEGNRIHFQCSVVETGKTCLSGAYVDLLGVASAPAKSPDSGGSGGSGQIKSEALFAELSEKIRSAPEFVKRIKQIGGIFQWDITSKNGKTVIGQWTIDLKRNNPAIIKGTIPDTKPDCSITISDDNFIELSNGKLKPDQAFLTGKVKIKGNLMLMQKMGKIFQENAKL